LLLIGIAAGLAACSGSENTIVGQNVGNTGGTGGSGGISRRTPGRQSVEFHGADVSYSSGVAVLGGDGVSVHSHE